MANINSIEILGDNDFMKEVDYFKVQDIKNEFIRSDTWEIRFLKYPVVVQYPGDELFQRRLREVTLSPNRTLNSLEANYRGHKVKQKTRRDGNDGTFSLTFTDREDQAIYYFFYDWFNKMSDRKNFFSFRTEHTYANIKLLLLNTSRVPIREYILYKCQPQPVAPPETFTGESVSNLGEFQVTFDFDHMDENILNTPITL